MPVMRGCSTPLGVTDLVTGPIEATSRSTSIVLNASRRHRLGHWPRERSSCRYRGVLNASRRHRLGHTTGPAARCAGRCVLNASRRHRLGHQRRRGHGRHRIFRAQRLSASQTWSRRGERSRPFLTACAQRLSASQTWSHSERRSTHARMTCAQRLSASQTWSRRTHVYVVSRLRGCSTPLGVTDLVTMEAGGRTLRSRSAQRLSASQTWSPPGRVSRDPPIQCSTPLGVTDLVTA